MVLFSRERRKHKNFIQDRCGCFGLHVIVFTDDLGSNRLLMFGIYENLRGAVPPRDFTLRLYESGPRFRAARPLRQGRSPPWILEPVTVGCRGGTRGAGDGIRVMFER